MSSQSRAQSGSDIQDRRVTEGRISARWFPLFMLLPALIFILVIMLFPLIYSLYVSFTPYELLKPNSLNFELSRALRNYQKLFADAIFWKSVGNTIVFLFLSINLSYVIALGLSQLLARVTRGQGIMRTLLMVPMMFAPILVGFQFRWFFNANVGLVNNLLYALGLMQERGQIAWLVDEPLGMFSIIVASIWMNLPVLTIILLAGTLSLPQETFEAADVDGANSWQQFRFITFPLLAPFSYIALTILSLDISRAFDIVRIMTDGGPAHRTELIWTYVTRLAIENTKFGLGSAMSWVTVVLAVVFTLYFFRQLVRSRVVQ
ncbi:MAG: sugar ABC transporter permease [Anaerolineaceae bacterium]|nr:sugar ABC transporter permease [Anaerolineaceae bacterium]